MKPDGCRNITGGLMNDSIACLMEYFERSKPDEEFSSDEP